MGDRIAEAQREIHALLVEAWDQCRATDLPFELRHAVNALDDAIEAVRRRTVAAGPDLDDDTLAHALNIATRERDAALAEVERLRREHDEAIACLRDSEAELKKEFQLRQSAMRAWENATDAGHRAELERLEAIRERDAARLQADEWKRYAEALSYGDPVCGRCGVAVLDEPAAAPLCDLCSGEADDKAE